MALWTQEALGSPMLLAGHRSTSECSACREEGIPPVALGLGAGSHTEEPSLAAPLVFYPQMRWRQDVWHGGQELAPFPEPPAPHHSMRVMGGGLARLRTDGMSPGQLQSI